jgi:hypothetical protein
VGTTYQHVCKHIYGVIQLAHREHNRAPVGAYNEDYHYFTYEEQPGGSYIEYKVIVAKNGTERTVMHEELEAEEYFKRKLAGTLKNDKLYIWHGGTIRINDMQYWLKK